MKPTTHLRWVLGLLTTVALASWTLSQEVPAPQNGAAQDEPIEVLTRGPIHEAFAQPVLQQPVEPVPVPKEPPPPIAEDPPQERPDMENAEWIPGYWSFDVERQEFLWVSGVYRVPPQGRTFIPGYWEHTAEGWRWVPGFWSNPNQQELPYAPEPPAPLDNGAQGIPPDDNSMYIPGVWVYRNDRFIWRAGYWSPIRVGHVWVPSHYCWTPNGYLFNDGYWDSPYDARGLCYAPVYFNRPLWQTAGWRYRPSYVVGFGAFFDSAFIRGGSFYYGNYYGAQYARLGYSPWYSGRGRYDPAFAYHGWQNHRNNPNWVNGVQQTYAERSAGRGAIPPRTLAQQQTLVAAKQAAPIVAPAAQFESKQVRVVKNTSTQIDVQRTNIQRTREIAVNRQQLEVAATKQGNAGNFHRVNEARTLKLPAVLDTKTPSPRPNPVVNGNPSPKIDTTIPRRNPYGITDGNQPKVDIRNNEPTIPRKNPYGITDAPPTPLPKKGTQPKVDIRNNYPLPQPQPKNVAPTPLPKNVAPNPLPKNAEPPLTAPKNVTPPNNVAPQPKNVAPPKVDIRNNPPPIQQPKFVAPQPAPKNIAPPTPAPRNVTPPTPAPAPRNVTPPTPAPAPRNVTPPPAPRNVAPPAPAPRANPSPPAPKRAAVNVSPPPVARPAPQPRAATAPAARVQSPASAPRVQAAPRPNNPAPRAQAPAPRSNPAPARSNPPSGGASKGRKR